MDKWSKSKLPFHPTMLLCLCLFSLIVHGVFDVTGHSSQWGGLRHLAQDGGIPALSEFQDPDEDIFSTALEFANTMSAFTLVVLVSLFRATSLTISPLLPPPVDV